MKSLGRWRVKSSVKDKSFWNEVNREREEAEEVCVYESKGKGWNSCK